MFTLGDEGALEGLLESAGFTGVTIRPVAVERHYEELDRYLEETVDMSPTFGATFKELSAEDQDEVLARVTAGARPFMAADGSVMLPGSSLVAVATA
jgi:hypothetical protein